VMVKFVPSVKSLSSDEFCLALVSQDMTLAIGRKHIFL
jgi:hypothetical protein